MKKVISCTIIALLVLSSFSPLALAKNNTDTAFSFEITGVDSLKFTPHRAKEDTSATYVYFQSSVDRYGDPKPTEASFEVWSSTASGSKVKVENSGKGIAVIQLEQKRLIHQHVYENGYRWAILSISGGTWNAGYYGLWSPDSLGSYPYAN